MKNVALILASGTGSRCGLDFPKQFAEVNGKCILQYTVDKFQNNENIDEIYLVTNSEYVEKVKELTREYSKVLNVVAGGLTRKDSSYNGIYSIPYDECNVLIHDGVRPLVTDEIINNCINELETKYAVCVAIDSTDTIYVTSDDCKIIDVPKRSALRRAQTPQCFKLSLIKKAHDLAKNDKDCFVTDDCGLIMHYNLADVYTTNGSESNIKITYPNDIEFFKQSL
ncbi:MAG: 2-C-methyl-D-erythritol 4-phosphate cytidylyltransferase [Cyanobacteria bacterium RUI128]|nr:2-C-methyl-D-erythritol 4-phosphate cytidylyltransferase [Cyanobacteria bacterium RUI128]